MEKHKQLNPTLTQRMSHKLICTIPQQVTLNIDSIIQIRLWNTIRNHGILKDKLMIFQGKNRNK